MLLNKIKAMLLIVRLIGAVDGSLNMEIITMCDYSTLIWVSSVIFMPQVLYLSFYTTKAWLYPHTDEVYVKCMDKITSVWMSIYWVFAFLVLAIIYSACFRF